MSVRPSDMIPVSAVQILSNMSVALNLCFLCNLGSPSQSSSVQKQARQAPNTATLQHDSSIRTRIELLDNYILRLPPKRAYGIATLMCLNIGTPKNNKFSICSKWKIHYFQVSQNLGTVQPHYNVLEYWDT